MDITTLTSQPTADTGTIIRALHSLSEPQACSIIAGLTCMVADWSIDRHESYDGHLSLVFVHKVVDTSIIVDRDKAGIHISLLLNDELHTTSHACATIGDAFKMLQEVAGIGNTAPQAHIA